MAMPNHEAPDEPETLSSALREVAPTWGIERVLDGWRATRDQPPGTAGATEVRAATAAELRAVLAEMNDVDARVALRTLKALLRERGIVANLYGQTLVAEAARRSGTIAVHRGQVRWSSGADIGPARELVAAADRIAAALL